MLSAAVALACLCFARCSPAEPRGLRVYPHSTAVKESAEKIERSQDKIVDIAKNLTSHLTSHRHLLEKVSGAYAETWRRGLVLESLMRDGLSLVNATRRELADGLRALARRQRDARLSSMQEVMDAQKRFVDTCQRVQLDDPTHVADVLDKLIDSLINKTASTFQELQNIQVSMRSHDNRVMKLLSAGRSVQSDATCRRLEGVFRNTSHTTFKETELQQLTEKFIALTERADATLQRLEARVGDDSDTPAQASDVTSAADRLMLKLKGIKGEQESEEYWGSDDQDNDLFDDGEGINELNENKDLLIVTPEPDHHTLELSTRTPHRRHLHKHPYDRALMDWLEEAKKTYKDNEAVTNEVAGQAHLENYALRLFLFADKQDREQSYGKNMVKAFYTAGMIYDVLTTFGDLTDEAAQNRKYAKWKAAYIHNCLKNGEAPVPGPIQSEGGEPEDSLPNEEPAPSGLTQAPGFTPAAPSPASLPTVPSSFSNSLPDPNLAMRAASQLPPVPYTPDPNPGGFVPYDPSQQPAPTSLYGDTTTSVAQLTPEQIAKAQKYCKWASSALNYEDIKTAITNLTNALELLHTGRDPA
ncbi:hypothetical protein MSG28_007373 [Choristoneura fumiferana]|uniref:Uncharacterized protein n=1 Tax=Choristoneura fumiferana TaxID=7141 RepID=A0ACC0JWZ4_CHOFU|nr:hypothetical protein MSG28_007373 [Choristoneura fumiferana]